MYDELIKRLREDKSWVEQGATDTEHEISEHIQQAADAIEKLQGTQMSVAKWIPVSERLPLYGQDVLAVRTYGDGEKYQEVLMAHIAIWNEETGEKWWNATNITHWMALPEPPKEEADE